VTLGLLSIDATRLIRLVPMHDAIRAIQRTLVTSDPDAAMARSVLDVSHGQLLVMPAELGRLVGCKLATVAPANPARGLERIQGTYIVFDGESLAPVAIVDGVELTSLRTPAVSAALVDLVATPDAATLGVIGTGPQAIRHVEAVRATRPITRVLVAGRHAGRAEQAARAMAAHGVTIELVDAAQAARADIVVCATSAATPVLEEHDVQDSATVVAVGSHERDRRELPAALLGRAQVIVETESVARTEAGDVIMAIADGALAHDDLATMRQIATGEVRPAADRPRVVKTCGMGWQDLAIAGLALERARQEG
jgi:ornithine cyclodeaminase/alanine dehydrogenase-like protein (mu-crystallin family)